MEPTAEPPASELPVELDGVRRRLDDLGLAVRKTQQAQSELAESMARLVTEQRRRDRWHHANSFVAYLLFTAILGGAMLVLYRSRAGELVRARDAAVAERDLARAQAKAQGDQLAARAGGAEAAFQYYQLVAAGKRTEAVSRFAELDPNLLTPTERAVFEQSNKQVREEIIDAGYLTGLDAARAGDHPKAITELRRALAYEDEGPRAAQMRYYLGIALVKTGAAAEARHELELALAGRVEQGGGADARYYLAMALEAAGDLEAARKQYDKFASAAATHPLAVPARRKAMALARQSKPTN